MVSFVSLFLGLVVGYQTVALEVAAPVTRVEILLDGRPVVSLDGPPWREQIDLGAELQPHELTAVAFDEAGIELDRTSQWLNLPRQPAETSILLEDDAARQRKVAKVSWKSLTGDEPSRVRAQFDGRALEIDDPRSIPLPPYDPELLHFLRVELEFAGFVTSSAEITFGGAYADRINTELTAFPVSSIKRKKFPAEEELRNGFLARDRPLRVAAIEKGQAELIVVRDRGAWSHLRRIRRQALMRSSPTSSLRFRVPADRSHQWFRSNEQSWDAWTFQFLWPVPRRLDGDSGTYDLFSHSAKLTATSGSLHGWLATLERPTEQTGVQRLADAVAVAAVTAAGGNRRRAILLVLGDEPADASDASPQTVRGYLETLAVPLFVWSVGEGESVQTAWGPATRVSTPEMMSRATREIFRSLEAQRIVWLEGLHLPQQIRLAPSVEALVRVAD